MARIRSGGAIALGLALAAGLSALPIPTLAGAPQVRVTLRVAGGHPCSWEPGCRVRFRVVRQGADTPEFKAVIDPDVAGASRVATLTPGAHEVRVTAIVLDDGQPYPIGSCGASLRLVADDPTVTLSAAMDWEQPACGIVIDPRIASGAPRPDLSTRIRQDGPPPRFVPVGRPTARATNNGVRLQLWVKDVTLQRGRWLLAHARVTNVSDRPIRYPGRFADLDCPPIDAVGDISGLFDPGRPWSGLAGTFKRRWLGSGILQRIGLWVPERDRGDGCGDVGRVGTLKPGQVADIPLVALPRYGLGRQPLPPGTIRLR